MYHPVNRVKPSEVPTRPRTYSVGVSRRVGPRYVNDPGCPNEKVRPTMAGMPFVKSTASAARTRPAGRAPVAPLRVAMARAPF